MQQPDDIVQFTRENGRVPENKIVIFDAICELQAEWVLMKEKQRVERNEKARLKRQAQKVARGGDKGVREDDGDDKNELEGDSH